MKDWGWTLELFVLGCVVLIAAVGVPLNRRINRKRRLASGWTEWCRTAARLPHRDRVRIYWANATGRAVTDPRLAELAAQRGEAEQAMLRAPVTRGGRLVMAAAGVCIASGGALRLAEDFPLIATTQVLGGLAFGFAAATVGRAGASAAANRRLVEHGHSPDT